MIHENSPLQARFKGGGSIIALPPVFSNDSQSIYVAWKNEIICYNTKSAKRTCSFKGTRHIVGFGCVYTDDEYIVACTVNRKVIIWKASNAIKLKEIKLDLKKNVKVKVFKVFVEGHDKYTKAKALICCENVSANSYEFNLLNLDNGHIEQQNLRLPSQNDSMLSVDVSGEQSYFAVAQGRNMYYKSFGSPYIKHSIKGRTFTCIACHTEEVSVLTGDNTGRILLWNNIAKKNSTQAVFHWHTLPAKTICSSTSGTYFYSGAGECVLVKWDQSDSHFKSFLPRLPAPIKYISVAKNNLLLAVATEDNAVQIVSPQLKVVNIIQHLVLGSDTSAGIVFDPRSKSLILNGVIGHVQLFSPKDMNVLYSLDVVGQNKYTEERDKKIINTIVSKVAIDNSGLWMATIEHRFDPEMFECRLKFWLFNSTKQNFSLNTSIEYPHESTVKDIIFQPSSDEFELSSVSIGEDKKIKIWQLTKISTVYYEGHTWRCSGEVMYKDLCAEVAAFSSDGSLIAVGFESVLTTWLSDEHKLKCSLRHPLQDDHLTHVSFGNGSECHLLFSATNKYISVWNLLSLSLTWTVRVDVAMVISDMIMPFKAIFTKNKKLFIVDLKSPNPIYLNEKMLRNVGDIQAAVFVPKTYINSDVDPAWYKRSCIYFLDNNYELYSIETEDEHVNFNLHIDESNKSLYSYLIPKIKAGMTSNASTTHMYEKENSNDKFRKFLDTPAHTMPPLHLTCEGILQSLILEHHHHNDKVQINGEDLTNNTDQLGMKNEEELLRDFPESLSKISKESTAWISIF